jgi:hypothetical protein
VNNWHSQIVKVIPDFELARCGWLRRLDLWDTAEGPCLRLMLEHAGRLDIALVAKGVREFPVMTPETKLGVLPYTPYDLGEFMIAEHEGGVVLFDELKGWRIVAGSVSLEAISPHAEGAG